MTIISIDDTSEIENQNILVDANILMFVDGAISYDNRTKKYSNAYFSLKKLNKLFTTEKCLDEFNNRLTKFYYELEKSSNSSIQSFKKHRKSEDFSTTMECIHDATISFIEDMTIIKDYNFIDCKKAFSDVRSGLVDFSDIISARFCIENNMYLFTDDSDAIYCRDLKIITGNSWTLAKAMSRNDFSKL